MGPSLRQCWDLDFWAGAGGDVVSHWHLPILSDNGDPQEAPVSLLESWGIL